jgi:hypothetical protein
MGFLSWWFYGLTVLKAYKLGVAKLPRSSYYKITTHIYVNTQINL